MEEQKLNVKIPGGYLVVETKGVEGEYPGVFIAFSEKKTLMMQMRSSHALNMIPEPKKSIRLRIVGTYIYGNLHVCKL